MANVAEKARFHLERAVPQLREFEQKEIFTKEEIRTLVSKRTEYEHLVLGPRCTPKDFQAYIAWELSLDRLRARRCARRHIRHSTSHASHARVFNLYERAVLRHPGSLALWRDYLDFAARVAKATRRWRNIVTRALRMHPTEPSLWLLAGQRAAQDGDMEGARGLFMRGCRFCTAGHELWVAYARVEMGWLAKVDRKQQQSGGKKGHDGSLAAHAVQEGDVMMFDNDDDEDEFEDGDGQVMLPDTLDIGQGQKGKDARKVFEEEAIKKLEKSPALQGAIPKAILDVARKQPLWGAPAGEAFFDMFAEFTTVSAQPTIIQHVLDAMIEDFPSHASTCDCLIRQPLVGVEITTAEFPRALREVLARVKTQLEATDDKKTLAFKTSAWISPLLAREDLDDSLRKVLDHTKRKLENS